MQLYLKNWIGKFLEELPKTENLRIISPFVKEQIIRKIHEQFDFSRFELVTRFNLTDFACNVSSLDALKFVVEQHAMVYGIKDLHSKVYIFDDRAAIVSSANLTNGGLMTNYECGIYISDPLIVQQLISYFNQLKSLTGNTPLSIQQCEIWQQQLAGTKNPVSNLPGLPDYGASQVKLSNQVNYFIKFFGDAEHRVPLSFQIRDEIDRSLCHYACGFSVNKRPRKIRTGDVVYMARMTRDPYDYAIFGKAIAIEHVRGRDEATENEKQQRDWKIEWPIYLRIKNTSFIDATMGDCVLLHDLMTALGHESFASTKRRFDNGERDIILARSLSQQAYVHLTQTAAEWLEPRFQEILSREGEIDSSFKNALPASDTDIANWSGA